MQVNQWDSLTLLRQSKVAFVKFTGLWRLCDANLTWREGMGGRLCLWFTEVFRLPTGFWAGRGGGPSWKWSDTEKRSVFTTTYWNLKSDTLQGDGLTWSGSAGDPDGGWSPGYTLFDEGASVAVHVMLRLDWGVIWIKRHWSWTVAVYSTIV